MEPPSPNLPLESDYKIRLMCSYGGQILSRPQTKSLYYAGGDTRMVTVPAPSNGRFSLSLFLSHLTSTLHLSFPFMVKYQLPNHGLDSLISVSTDEDLLVMLEEHRLLASAPHRIRIFLYPLRHGSPMVHDSELKHPKRESFFVDALKGVVGYNGDESGGPESIALETTSSFGSTSSSTSFSNLPSLNGDRKVKSPHPKISSGDSHVSATVFCPQQFSTLIGNPFSTIPFQSEGLWRMPMRIEPQVQPYYVPQNHPSLSPYYVFPNPNMMSQSQHLYQQTSQPPAIYYLPVEPHYNMPVQGKPFLDQCPQSVRPNAAEDVSQEKHEEVIVSQDSLEDGEEQLEDAAMVQIYKSQPPPPASLAQFQVIKAPNLNETLEQLHLGSSMQVKTTPQ